MSNQFNGTGNVGNVPDLRTVMTNRAGVQQQAQVLELRVIFDAYKKDAQDEWVQDDAASFWKTVVLWNERAERAFRLLKKGVRVHVVGQIKGEKWADKATGEEKTSDYVLAEEVFVSLARVESIAWRANAPAPATAPGHAEAPTAGSAP